MGANNAAASAVVSTPPRRRGDRLNLRLGLPGTEMKVIEIIG
jgi:hypothetical protein